jgi:hypothetical protein
MPEEVFEIFRKEYINYFDPLDITAADFINSRRSGSPPKSS